MRFRCHCGGLVSYRGGRWQHDQQRDQLGGHRAEPDPPVDLVWCANNRRTVPDPRPLAERVTCAGCGQPGPPPVPNPYQR